ncbi:hypothetical protein [Citrobacter portucalensis]|uniref:hypothetical protein n=1 Tax=Citrobacter portucalensis TaxID=1639133 RepID=UPI0039906DB2
MPFYSQLLLGIEDNCRDHGIALSFLSIGPGDAVSEQVLLHQPDALICAGFFEPELLGLLQQMKLPLVLVESLGAGPALRESGQHPGRFIWLHNI